MILEGDNEGTLKGNVFFFSNYFLPNDLKVISKITVGMVEFRREI